MAQNGQLLQIRNFSDLISRLVSNVKSADLISQFGLKVCAMERAILTTFFCAAGVAKSIKMIYTNEDRHTFLL